jgi:hypothetical protein
MIILSLLIQTIKNLLECFAYKPNIAFFKLKEDGRDLLFHLGILRGVKITDGNVKNEGKICVFASYQPSGINPLLLYYIKYLKEVMGFAIIFTSNCKLSEPDKEKLKPYTYKIVERANVGRDFGSYKYSILRFEKEIKNASLLLLANDSVYGPIQDLKPFLKKIEEGYDIVADQLVDEIIWPAHFTSYFILMTNKVVNSNKFWKFWKKKYKYKSRRHYVINGGETRFSSYALKGFKSIAIINPSDVYFEFNNMNEDDKRMMRHSSKMHRDFSKEFDTLNLNTLAANHFPFTVLNLGGFFVKRDWVKKCIISSFLINKLKETEFATDIDKVALLRQLHQDSFLDRKTIKLMNKGLL